MGSLRSLLKGMRRNVPREGVPIEKINWTMIKGEPGFEYIVKEFRKYQDKKIRSDYVVWSQLISWKGTSPYYRFNENGIEVQCHECGHISSSVFIRLDMKEISCVSCLGPYWRVTIPKPEVK